MAKRGSIAAFVLVAVMMIAYCAANLRVGTDITNFLPIGSSSEIASLSSQLADSPLTRTIVISIGGEDLATAIEAARTLSADLRRRPEVAWLRSGVGEADIAQIHALYFPRRLAFLSDRPEATLPELLAEPALRERARKLRNRLASPASGFFEPLASADPLGAFEQIVTRMRVDEPALGVVDGQLVTRDEKFAIVLLGTRGSAFDSATQGVLLDHLSQSADAINERLGSALEFEVSAVGAFAVAAERSIKRDVYVIAACSVVGVALLFGAFVGSMWGFLIASIPPAAGILVATTASLLIFGELDGLTMAFGASLMGIVIDYSNHLLLHHGLARPPVAPARIVTRLRPSLVLGAFTTAASFVGLGMTPFPAFREMSFFAITGVLSGLAVSLWVLPPLLSRVPALPKRSERVAHRLDAAFRRMEALPRGLLLAPVAIVGLVVVAWPDLEWSDDPSELTRTDPTLAAEDRRVRERVAQLEGGRFVVAVASDAASAVARNDEIYARLQTAVTAGAVDGVRSLHGLLWSEELQRRNVEMLKASPGLYERLDASFVAEGFRPGAFAAFGESLHGPPPPVLRLADLRDSPLADLLKPFVFEIGDRVAVVTYLRGLRHETMVRESLAGMEGVYLLDQRSFVNDIYREFRKTSLRQVVVGGVLVVFLLVLRYRAWKPVVAAFLPSVLVALTVLTALAWLGEPANLLHVMSLVMVMGIGVDYGIFCVDSVGRRDAFGATLLSLLLSCLTTALVFGTMAISAQPALRGIGVTTGIGIPLCFLLAPVTLAAVRLGGPPGGRDD